MLYLCDPTNISRIEFYIDGVKRFEATSSPYQWTWTERTFAYHNIEINAINITGETKTTNINVWKFF
ncbi:MAG: hypothetical protein IMZ43_01275 [Thermoplasmata archaeon]|nr:hypothetical protein [Thermoplasmata archaeon]